MYHIPDDLYRGDWEGTCGRIVVKHTGVRSNNADTCGGGRRTDTHRRHFGEKVAAAALHPLSPQRALTG